MQLAIEFIDTAQGDVESRLDALRRQLSPDGEVVSERGRQKTIEVFGRPLTPAQVVDTICSDVKARGMEAVLEYTKKLDGAELTADSVRVSSDEFAAARAAAAPELLETAARIRDNILRFQTAILHQNVAVEREPGMRLEQRYVPLRRVGICVPGGAAAYPSTVLMTAVPAAAAGVKELVVVAPPTEFGANNSDVLAVCDELGISEVYRIGGAQAVAALAYGVDGLPPVQKIVGPGNLFVALAKRQVFGVVDIDSIAGPSEVVIIADETAHPAYVAADMLAQAEHAPGASILVTWSNDLLENVRAELSRQVENLERCELTVQSLREFGRLILVRDQDEACRITDMIAPEHLHIQCAEADQVAARLDNAGAVFVGDYTPVAVGDYVAGPSHVLPTGGTAQWARGLSANDFLRSHSVVHYTREALEADATDLRRLADKEGLTAHRASVDVRLSDQ